MHLVDKYENTASSTRHINSGFVGRIRMANFLRKYRIKNILEGLKPFITSEMNILDIGSGDGVIVGALESEFQCKIIKADVSAYCDNVILIKENKLPFNNNHFDIVTIIDTLHHIPEENFHELLSECNRVAKEVLIFEPKKIKFIELLDIILNRYFYGYKKMPVKFRDKSEWKKFRLNYVASISLWNLYRMRAE